MPNGKGTLDCCYCVHFAGGSYPDGHGVEALCRFHQTILPKAKDERNNRICCHFEPREAYHRHNGLGQFLPLVRRFAWFGADLEPGVLYEFLYVRAATVTKSAVLRIPDYQNNTWRPPSA